MFSHVLDESTELQMLERRHAPELFALIDANRPALRRWMVWLDRTRCIADSESFIETTMYQHVAGNGMAAGIWYQGSLAGTISFNKIDRLHRMGTIGYWLGDAFQGRGIMTAACRAMVAHAFGPLDLARVEIRCATENTKSRAIPERLGFTQEGILRDVEWLYDRFVDHAIYGRLARDP